MTVSWALDWAATRKVLVSRVTGNLVAVTNLFGNPLIP